MSRKIEDLTPEAQALCYRFAGRMAEIGIPWMLTRTRSTANEQAALHAQGRLPLDAVNRLRAIVKWQPIREKENFIVTWTMKSKHLIGEAFDIAILLDGVPTWEPKVNVNKNDILDYVEAGQIGEEIGLVWGGRFKNRADAPHFQLKEVPT
jgi:peptidoglycan L-alanyl-D-glutamate endopeptidase CwlK